MPLADWKTYLKWQALHSFAGSLSAPIVEENYNFYGAYLEGTELLKPRWKRCVEATDDLLGEALGQEYVARYFPPEYKLRTQEMVKNLLLAMKDEVNGLDWMGPETKKKALEKIATFNPKDRLSGQVEGLQQRQDNTQRILYRRVGRPQIRR